MNRRKRTSNNASIHEAVETRLRLRELLERAKESEERHSEQRIRYFLTLLTAILGGMGFLLKEGISKSDSFVAATASAFALLILFGYGLLTFARIIWSRRTTDRFDSIISSVTCSIRNLDTELYLELFRGKAKTQSGITNKVKGTLAQFMYLTQGLLAAAIVTSLGTAFEISIVYIGILDWAVFSLVVLLLFAWSEHIRRVAQKEDQPDRDSI
ncbi:MAG: hypothetical protein HYY49_14810 [Ignavibacteriales bacterium]|nr:hypothetical protein [Ignavibacteriales bacterium]